MNAARALTARERTALRRILQARPDVAAAFGGPAPRRLDAADYDFVMDVYGVALKPRTAWPGVADEQPAGPLPADLVRALGF